MSGMPHPNSANTRTFTQIIRASCTRTLLSNLCPHLDRFACLFGLVGGEGDGETLDAVGVGGADGAAAACAQGVEEDAVLRLVRVVPAGDLGPPLRLDQLA